MAVAELKSEIEKQREIVAQVEEDVRRREEWYDEQKTAVSYAGLLEARRDLAFYRAALRRLEAQQQEASL